MPGRRRAARDAAVQRRRRLDHRPGVSRRRRLRLRALTQRRRPVVDGAVHASAGRWILLCLVWLVLRLSPYGSHAPEHYDRAESYRDPGARLGPAPQARGGRRPRSGRPARRSAPPKWRQELASQLGGHATDALAIGLFVLALVAALGIYSNLAGPSATASTPAASLMLGAGRVVVPLALLVAAVRCRPPARRRTTRRRRDLRLGLGLGLVVRRDRRPAAHRPRQPGGDRSTRCARPAVCSARSSARRCTRCSAARRGHRARRVGRARRAARRSAPACARSRPLLRVAGAVRCATYGKRARSRMQPVPPRRRVRARPAAALRPGRRRARRRPLPADIDLVARRGRRRTEEDDVVVYDEVATSEPYVRRARRRGRRRGRRDDDEAEHARRHGAGDQPDVAWKLPPAERS